MIIGEIMTSVTVTVTPDDLMSTAIERMIDNMCSSVIVVDGDFPVGIFTENDAVRTLSEFFKTQEFPNLLVREVMSTQPECLILTTPLYDALLLTRDQGIKHLIVVDEQKKIVGLVTQTDLVGAYVQWFDVQKKLEIDNLELYQLSNEDPLMEIGNRRAMNADLDFIQATAKRHNKSYAVALIDVDFFKKYNDLYGHQMGDVALAEIASAIKKNKRDSDRLYRYGGEEILLLMPETDADAAMVAAERVRAGVESLAREHEESNFGHLTVSIGVASGIGDKWSSLVASADAALYRAKKAGRNQLAVASQGQE